MELHTVHTKINLQFDTKTGFCAGNIILEMLVYGNNHDVFVTLDKLRAINNTTITTYNEDIDIKYILNLLDGYNIADCIILENYYQSTRR